MTFIELLLTASISALVATAGATMIYTITGASLDLRDARANRTAGHYVLARIGSAIRQARGTGVVTSTAMTIWTTDRNGDDQVNLDETALIEYDTLGREIAFAEVVPPLAGSLAVVSDADFKSVSALRALMGAVETKTLVWAEQVETFALAAYPDFTDTRLVLVRFTIGLGADEVAFQTAACPKAPGDYLFATEAKLDPASGSTRWRRKFVSPWDGITALAEQGNQSQQ